MALAALDGTIVSTAVPQIVGDLGGFSVFSWLFSGYLLAVTVTLPVYGKLSDTFGRKPVLIAGIVVFLLGSLLCAAAWNMAALIAFRIVQGLGGGALQGTVQTIAADLYPLKERPKIQAKLSTVWAMSSVAGPALGGLLAGVRRLALDLPGQPADRRARAVADRPPSARARRDAHRPPPRPAYRLGGRAGACSPAAACCSPRSSRAASAWPWLSAPSIAFFGAGAALAALDGRRWNAGRPNRSSPAGCGAAAPIAAVNLALGALGLLMVAPTVFLPTYAQSVLGLGPDGGRLRPVRDDAELAGVGRPAPAASTTASASATPRSSASRSAH